MEPAADDRDEMALSRRQCVPTPVAKEVPPIQYLTENGFSIVRLCDIDDSVTDTPELCRFIVRSESGWKREVSVKFAANLVAEIQGCRRKPLLSNSLLWLVCAEQCLATYLWERNDYPVGGHLTVSELPVDQLLLAIHWTDKVDESGTLVMK